MGFWNYIKNLRKQIAGLTASHAVIAAAAALTTAQLVQCENPDIVKVGDEPTAGWYTIYEGQHNSVPMVSMMFTAPSSEEGKIVYDSLAIYNLGDVDQLDWNKVVGIKKMHLLPMPQQAAIVVERYDTLNNVFQFAPYFNLPDSIVFPTRDEIFNVALGDTLSYKWSYANNEATISLIYQGHTITKSVGMTLRTYLKIHPWHGGNKSAPTTRMMYLK